MILFSHGNNCIALYNEIRLQFDIVTFVEVHVYPEICSKYFVFRWAFKVN